MTRVNVVPVQELTDQHLIAEYRELPMVPASLSRTLKSKAGLVRKKISSSYTLNSGHVYFFYDKGLFLRNRYRQVVGEMKKRGFKPSKERSFPTEVFKENGLFNNWTADETALQINRERISQKIQQKPNWYRKTGYKE